MAASGSSGTVAGITGQPRLVGPAPAAKFLTHPDATFTASVVLLFPYCGYCEMQ